jgi:hypothetical protein
LKPQGDAQKRYRIANFSLTTKVNITFYVPTQRVFTVKISENKCVGKLFLCEKMKKSTTTIFFNIFFGSDDLQQTAFLKIRKNHKKQKLYNEPLLKAAFTVQ